MKRWLICWVLIITLMFSLCACSTVVDENGDEIIIICDKYRVIEKLNMVSYIVYDMDTMVVYHYRSASHSGQMAPYQIYKDGAIYGAVYEDGQIIAKPYALGITNEMVEDQFSSWFN